MSTIEAPQTGSQSELPLDFRASIAARAQDGPDAAELRPGSSREAIVAQTLFGPDARRVSFGELEGDARELLFDGRPTRLKLAPRGLAVGPHVVARVDGSAGTLRGEDWTIFSPRRLARCVTEELERLDALAASVEARRPKLEPVESSPPQGQSEAQPRIQPAPALRIVDWGVDDGPEH